MSFVRGHRLNRGSIRQPTTLATSSQLLTSNPIFSGFASLGSNPTYKFPYKVCWNPPIVLRHYKVIQNAHGNLFETPSFWEVAAEISNNRKLVQ